MLDRRYDILTMIKKNYPNNVCRCCGLDYNQLPGDPIWGIDGESGSHDLCLCCNIHFGYEDIHLDNIRKYRFTWLLNGLRWNHSEFKPNDWNPLEQLKKIPDEYV